MPALAYVGGIFCGVGLMQAWAIPEELPNPEVGIPLFIAGLVMACIGLLFSKR